MSDSSTPKERSKDSALAYTWGQYRVFAATSRGLKTELSKWRFRVLILSIAGALFATTCQQLSGLELSGCGWGWLPGFFGILSAIALGLAAYFAKEILNPVRERNWVRARSLAESLKAETHLFAANAPPYNKNDAIDQLFERTEELLEPVNDLATKTITEKDKGKGIIPGSISVKQYIQKRVNDQIDNFYNPSAIKNDHIVKKGKQISLGLGVLAVILGAFGATGWTAAWVGVVTTITLAIAAYLYAGRYQYLVISYQATARRLGFLRSRWQSSGMTDADEDERNQFIRDCEEAISVENGAWMAEWTQEKKKGKTKP